MSSKKIIQQATETGWGSPGSPGGPCGVQAQGNTSSGSGSAVIAVYVGNDPSCRILAGTITLTLGEAITADGFAILSHWKFIRSRVTTLTGTGAEVEVSV